VHLTNLLRPDLVVLTGDYVSSSAAFAPPCAEELASLNAPHGVSAILGNHDEWIDAQRIADDLQKVGIRFLRNDVQEIRAGNASLWLVGIDDAGVTGISWQRTLSREEFATCWSREREAFEELKAGIPTGDLAILLVHNPDFVETVTLQGISLALCGHTHGGQIRIPVVGPPLLPSIHGQKYASGLSECQGTPVYVNRGIGVMGLPLRFLCRPEITLIRLRSA
jgi:predicted MPP superfamily phosphohydrolase